MSGHRALLERFRRGEESALARAITLVENERPGFEELLEGLHGAVGRARRIGITGPPGSGKSTLTAALARRFRARGLTVGVVAVDPTSPLTGGALLGDRVRMSELATVEGIFIRSMASRGSLGGLAAATREVADLMDAFGLDRVLLETVGVGQSELRIAGSADTTVVVLVPESGDAIQAMKAGLLEVCDVFVVNKADRPGADRLTRELEIMKMLRTGEALRGIPGAGHHGAAGAGKGAVARDAGEGAAPEAWEPPVLPTVASGGEGVEELAEQLDEHFAWLQASGELERRRRGGRIEQARLAAGREVERRLEGLWRDWVREHGEELASGRLSPYVAARRLAERLAGGGAE